MIDNCKLKITEQYTIKVNFTYDLYLNKAVKTHTTKIFLKNGDKKQL